ncbi:hypothetical protein [Cellvibrio sp. KY-GH-1]|uniref:hypothetical protein n=1 Tax=Cellvibrio sp. KY-GH-1 TaxID=2303332 RepID=UPI0012450BAA|nr:hypothetical protein [Cellvibrio sp. KY-GH-1]
MNLSWRFTRCNISSTDIKYSQTITEDGNVLSVIFDNFISAGTVVDISLPLASRFLSSKTVCVDIRGASVYELGVQKLTMNSTRRADVWGKQIHGKTSFFIPLRLTAYRNQLVFSLSIESDHTGNQIAIDTIDFFKSRI